MKKKLHRKLELNRETLRSLAETNLRGVAGVRSDTCVMQCGSGPNTGCFDTCLCTSPVVCE